MIPHPTKTTIMRKKYIEPTVEKETMTMITVIATSDPEMGGESGGGGGDAKSRNEFEDFVQSQEGTKTNSLW